MHVETQPPPTGVSTEDRTRQLTQDSPGTSYPRKGLDAKRTTLRWARWLHVYTSMIALLLILFFGITGITLNHPTWTFGDATSSETQSGVLAVDPVLEDGSVDWLSVAEEIRATYDVKGTVSEFDLVDTEGNISFANPGYSADLFFDTADSSFEITIEQEGFLAVMNDLHKGRDSGSAWSWVIDLSAGFLVAVSLTGLTMQVFLRKRRRSALALAGVGAVVSAVLIWLTVS